MHIFVYGGAATSTASPAEVDRPLPTPRRGLSPRCGTEEDDPNEGAGLSGVTRNAARSNGTLG